MIPSRDADIVVRTVNRSRRTRGGGSMDQPPRAQYLYTQSLSPLGDTVVSGHPCRVWCELWAGAQEETNGAALARG